jgi:alpha-tubulin suppressor-like RCC1 family protein
MDSVAYVFTDAWRSWVIKTDGSLWAWGSNGDSGRLGDGTTANRHFPVKIMDSVASVSIATYHAMAIKKDGSLWTWGMNKQGQLGDGTTTDRHSPVKIMDSVASVSANGWLTSHTAAIKTDGSLWVWGANEQGQLGDGTTEDRHSPVKIMDSVAMFPSGSRARTMAIKTDGSLWAWGSNEHGQLGDGTVTTYKDVDIEEYGVDRIVTDDNDRNIPVKIMDGLRKR